jgi:hypothetical protein
MEVATVRDHFDLDGGLYLMATTLEAIASLYKNILGRDGSSSETAYWVGRVGSGAQSLPEVVQAFTVSDEAVENVAPVISLYFTAFARVPDSAGLQFWLQAHQNGMSLDGIARALTLSDEFQAQANVGDSDFVASIYHNALGRNPDAAGLDFWAGQLAGGMSREQVLTSISRSQESDGVTGLKAQVVLAYNGLLGRSPSRSEVETVLKNQGDQSAEDLIKQIAQELIAGNDQPVTPAPPLQPAPPAQPTLATFTPEKGSTAGSSDASAAVALDNKYMIVGDDEASVLRVYDRAGGDAVLEWDYSGLIGSTGELDLEAMTMVGDTLFVTGSHSNTKKGVDADSREVVFSVKVSGTGAQTQFDYQRKFTGLEAALVAWDQGGGSGKAAGYFGFAASSGAGIAPENTNGFSIEGMTTSLDDNELWLGFRAPQTDTTVRDKALIVPIENYRQLLEGAATQPTFGSAVELDLGGRGIRSIEKAKDGSGYLIIAGPSGVATPEVTHDFRLYTWDGKSTSQPVELDNNLDALLKVTGGCFESIVSLDSIKPGTLIQLLQDNGDTVWSGQTDVSKDLDPADQRFNGNVVSLGSPVVDKSAPVLVAASPADNSAGVAVSTSLSLTFDEGVALGSGTIELRDGSGHLVQSFAAGGAGVKVDYNKITLQPTNKLGFSTDYTLVLNKDAFTNHSGNALAANVIDFITGVSPHYVLISEVNSNAVGGDFFELFNYGSTTVDLSGWKMNDEAGTFLGAIDLPGQLTLGSGEALVIAPVKAADFAAFKSAWGLNTATNVVSIDGPGLGKADAVVLFDGSGNVATAFHYGASDITASDGTVVSQAPAVGAFVDKQHAGAAYGGAATVSAVWDGVSTSDPHYVAAVAGDLQAVGQVANPTSVGSPGLVSIVQTGVVVAQPDGFSLVA